MLRLKRVSPHRRKALRFKDIFDMEKWNKEDGKGKTFKHIRWIPTEGKFNVPERFVELFKARAQREWVDDNCKGDKVKMVMLAIEKGGLAATESRKAKLYSQKIECFYYINGNYSLEEVSSMIREYNQFCETNRRDDLKIETKKYKSKVEKKDMFQTFFNRH
jgi:hypothetical protein